MSGGGSARGATVVTDGLTRRFGAHVAVQPLTVALEPGGTVGLVGPNGSGKSTFLRMLLGLVSPSGGSAVVAGVALAGDGTPIRRRAAFCPGEIALYGELSGRAMLRFLARARPAGTLDRALALGERLGLPLAKRVRTYSHGMKRQLLFAAALAPDVPLRVLDEPTEGLDPSKRGEVLAILAEDRRPDRTVLLSSHHLGEIERTCDRLLFLDRGRVIADERAAELAARARRLVRLVWGAPPPEPALRAGLERLGARTVAVHDGTVAVELAADDPLPFLAGLGPLCRAQGIGAPARVEYGKHSLEDLYRDLYGVDGF